MLSRLLVPALLRPLGEHLVAMLAPQPGETCAYLDDDEGVMRALLERTGARCSVLRDDLRPASVHVIAGLFAPIEIATLDLLPRLLDPQRGRLACAVLLKLPGLTLGHGLPIMSGHPFALARIRDVARFDGIAHYHAATGAGVAADVLQPFTGVDGTIRLPVEAVVVQNREVGAVSSPQLR